MKKHKKPDQSQYIAQGEKIKDKVLIREFKWTEKQQKFIDLALNKDTKIIFVSGPAGSSKTLCSTYVALELLNQKSISDIVYVRSAVESADSKLGYLPGTQELKMEVYATPLFNKLDELLNKADVSKISKEGKISVMPPNYARGLQWNVKCILIDEAQNFSYKELVTLITRIGKFSKCFILADPAQSDLSGRSGAFVKLQELFNDEEAKKQGIYAFEFTADDIMRSELVKFIVKRLEQPKPA